MNEHRLGGDHFFAGRYRLDAVLGSGAVGVVYDATDCFLRRRVALKVLTASARAVSPTAVERFKLETEVLASITHPNVVAVYDAGTSSDGTPFLVMELLFGLTLEEWLRERGRLSVEQLFQIAPQLCRALRRVHAAGVVHRDIKPSNIVVTEEDDGALFVKLVDFGVARLVDLATDDPSEVPTHLTSHGNLVGSPLYMSPEQIVGDEVDPRADVYSLGATLYHLLTGRPPFSGERMIDVLGQHLRGTAPPPSHVIPTLQCPVRLERTIVACLSRQPELRPPSAEALLRELRDAWVEWVPECNLAPAELPSIRWESEVVIPLPLLPPELNPGRPTEDASPFLPTIPPAAPSRRFLTGPQVGALWVASAILGSVLALGFALFLR